MVEITNSKHNTHFLLSFDVSVTKNPLIIVPIYPKNSIENFVEMKGGAK